MITTSDPNEKVHKAAILRSSIDTIKFLQNSNTKLEKENKALRSRKCVACGAEQQQSHLSFEGGVSTNDNLRDLLINSPPLSELSSGGSSPSSDGGMSGNSSPARSPPDGASMMLESSSNNMKSGNGTGAAPLVLFAVACGLFLINPGTNESGLHHHVTKRETVVPDDDQEPTFAALQQFVPRITAMVLNLIVFLFLYKVLGLFTSTDNGDQVATKRSNNTCDSKSTTATVQTPPGSFKRLRLIKEFVSTLMMGRGGPPNLTLANAYVSASRTAPDSLTRQWLGLKVIQNSLSAEMQDTLLSGLMLVDSKIMVKSVLSRVKCLIREEADRGKKHDAVAVKLHPLFEFGYHHIVTSGGRNYINPPNAFTTEIPSNLLGNVMQSFKHECLTKGITRLLVNGDRSTSTWFKNCLRAVVSEARNKGSTGVQQARDHVAEWWACVLWVEAEWLVTRGNGNSVHLEKLFAVIDSIWRNQIQKEKRCVEQPLFKAVYFAHRVRREIITVSLNAN